MGWSEKLNRNPSGRPIPGPSRFLLIISVAVLLAALLYRLGVEAPAGSFPPPPESPQAPPAVQVGGIVPRLAILKEEAFREEAFPPLKGPEEESDSIKGETPLPAPPPAKDPEPKPAFYTLQLGAMVEKGNAERLKRKLAELGYPAFIQRRTLPLTRYLVTLGEYPSRSEAEAVLRRLDVDGLPPGGISEEGDRFVVKIGSLSKGEAVELADLLRRKGYTPKIVPLRSLRRLYRVRVGPFEELKALQVKEELKGKGFHPLLVMRGR